MLYFTCRELRFYAGQAGYPSRHATREAANLGGYRVSSARELDLCPRWNTWATIQAVQFDWERTPKERPVRLAAPTARRGDPVRIRMSGVEIEAVIADASTPVLHVRVKLAAVKASRAKTKRTRTA